MTTIFKPGEYTTLSGLRATVYEVAGDRLIGALTFANGERGAYMWDLNGGNSGISARNLRPPTYWINIYEGQPAHKTREDADNFATPGKRIACVEFRPGDGL